MSCLDPGVEANGNIPPSVFEAQNGLFDTDGAFNVRRVGAGDSEHRAWEDDAEGVRR